MFKCTLMKEQINFLKINQKSNKTMSISMKIFCFWFLPQVFFNIRFTSYINFRINPFSLLIFLSMLIPGFDFVLGINHLHLRQSWFSSIIPYKLLGNFLSSYPHKMFSSCNRSWSSNFKIEWSWILFLIILSLEVFTF